MNRPGEATLIRNFRGQCTPEEEKAIQVFLAMKTDQEYVANCLQEAASDPANEHDTVIGHHELDRAWAKLTERRQQTPVLPLKPRLRWYAYAAAVALFIACGTTFYLAQNHTSSAGQSAIASHQMRAAAGQIKKLQLPDSSTVILFAGSVIEVPENFGDTDRRITLTGKAFFDVAPNADKPFYVMAQGLTTQVLGTAFEVNAPGAADAENIITLHSGKVSIQKEGKEIARLAPDQQIHYQKATGRHQVQQVEAAYTIAWLKGEFDYDQVALHTILHDIENWYGIHITTAAPALLNRKITISFKELPVERALTMLSKSAGFSYTRQGASQIIIKERRAMH